jgi:hypothetical protein
MRCSNRQSPARRGSRFPERRPGRQPMTIDRQNSFPGCRHCSVFHPHRTRSRTRSAHPRLPNSSWDRGIARQSESSGRPCYSAAERRSRTRTYSAGKYHTAAAPCRSGQRHRRSRRHTSSADPNRCVGCCKLEARYLHSGNSPTRHRKRARRSSGQPPSNDTSRARHTARPQLARAPLQR